MKVLAVSPRPLWPIDTGLELRVYNLLKPLASKHEIDIICFAPPEEKRAEATQVLGETFRKVQMIPFEYKQPQGLGKLGIIKAYFFKPEIFLGALSTSPEMKKIIDTTLKNEKYDLIYLNTGFTVPYFLDITDKPLMLDAIDDPSRLFYSHYRASKGLASKISTFLDWQIFRRFEKKYYPRFREIILTTPADAAETKKLCPNSTATAIPNGVDADSFTTDEKRSEIPTVIFTGVMDYESNSQAALYFSRQILPLILKKNPELKFIIVGRRPGPAIMKLAENSANIEVTGEVADMRPYLGQAHVYVCPLISGSGIKNKILEAWSAGLPVVATPLSCEGIAVAPGEDILVAERPEEFAEKVIDLIDNRELADKLAQNGRKKVRERYDWKSKADILEKIWLRAAADFKD